MGDMTPEEKIMDERIKDPCVYKPCQAKIADFIKVLFDDPHVVGGELSLEVEIKSPKNIASTAPRYTWKVSNGKIIFTCKP